MNVKKTIRTVLIIVLLVSNIGCDQISKNMVRKKVGYYEQIELIDNHFTLTKVENSGAFLSLGDSLPGPIKLILLNILPLIALLAGIVFLLVKSNLPRLSTIGLSFILGGGVGNIYDRILHGSVTDFFHMDFVIFQTGVFNMADVSIMTGLFIIVFEALTKKKPELEKESNESV